MKLKLYLVLFFLMFGATAVQAEENRRLSLVAPIPEQNEQKIALVIGNANYESSPLKNPVNDARAMKVRLKALGFEVIEYENLKQKQMGEVLRAFRAKLKPGAVALFFYAGHGLQIKGVNYLPSVDADIVSEDDVPFQSLNLNRVFDVMAESKTRLNLVFLDACRNNPYTRSFRSLSDGLAKVDAPSGTLISFATRPGSVARDGVGNNGLYTQHLLDAMDVPGLTVEQTLKRVVRNVRLASKGAQEPWMEGSIDGEFHFRAPIPVEKVTDETVELAFWAMIKDSTLLADFDTYLSRYAKGKFAAQAKEARGKLIEAELKESKRREEEMRKLALMQQRMEEERLKREADRIAENRRDEVEAKRRDEEVKKLIQEKQRLEKENLAREAERTEARRREEADAKRREEEMKKLTHENQKLEQERLAQEVEQAKRREASETSRRDEEMKKLILKQERLEKENYAREAERREARQREEAESKRRDDELKKLALEKQRLEEENRRIQIEAQEQLLAAQELARQLADSSKQKKATINIPSF